MQPRSRSRRSRPSAGRARAFVAAAAAALLAAGCASSASAPPPPPDPRVELARHNDEYWAYLTATYDADGDGRVVRAEYTRRDDSFARLDRDRDGELTRADLDRELVLPADLVAPMLLVRIAGGREATSAPLPAMRDALRKLDTSGDGRVNRAEFESVVPPFMPGVDSFATLLAGMDGDRDGLLSTPEIERWLARRDGDADGALVLRERTAPGPAPREGFIAPEERTAAPDFVVTALAGGQPLTLSQLVGNKPIALVFGSFT